MKILFCIILIFFLFGCTELSRQEKNLCESLTNSSYAYVPTCTTTEACYEKVNLLFKTDFDYSINDKIYSLKNHLARSWMYFNKTKAELKNISTSCSKNDITNLVGQINQMKFYLSESFLELDLTSQESFSVIQAKANEFEQQEIFLLPEEPIYYSEIELKQILSELKTGKTNSNTYISYYLTKVDEFNKKSFYRGYPELVEKTPFWLKTAIGLPAGFAKEEKLFFPFIQQGFDNIFSYLETKFYISESLKALESFPAKEVMKLYSDIGGNQNSSIKRFADLINKISIDEKTTKEKIPGLWSEAEKTSNQIKLLLEKESELQKYSELAQILLEKNIEIDKNDFFIFDNLLGSINQLKIVKAKENLTVGKEINELKEIISKSKILLLDLQTRLQPQQELLEKACNEKATYKVEQTINPILEKIASEISYLEKAVRESIGEKKILYCVQLTKNILDYELGLKNYALLESKKEDETKECFAFLEQTLKTNQLSELKLMFERLKQEIVTKENLLYFNEACNEIKVQTIKEINEDFEVKILFEEYKKIEGLLKKYWLAETFIQTKNFEKKLGEIEEYVSKTKHYFNENEINSLFTIKKELFKQITDRYQTYFEALTKEVIEFLEKNITFETIEQTQNAVAGKIKIKSRLIINNPFWDIDNLKLKTQKINGHLIEKSDSIEAIIFGEETQLFITKLNEGKTYADFEIDTEIRIEEEDNFIYVTTQTSLIERKININSEVDGIATNISTSLPAETKKVQVFLHSQEVNYAQKQNSIIFEAKTGEIATIFLYVTKLLESEITQIDQQILNELKTKLIYLVSVKNKTDKKLDGTIIFDVPINNFVEEIKVYDEIMTEKRETLIGSQILLKNQEFIKHQIRQYRVELIVNGLFDYYKQSLKDLLIYLDKENESLIKKINSFLDYPFSKEALAVGEKLLKETQQAVKQNNEKLEEERNKLIIKEKVEEEILKLKNKISLLVGAGLKTEAEKVEELLILINARKSSSDITILTSIFDLINNTKTSLSKNQKEEVDRIWKEVQKNNLEGFEELKDKIAEKKEIFDKLYLMDAETAFLEYVEIKKVYQEYALELEKNKDAKENEAYELGVTITTLKKDCLQLVLILEKELDREEELIRAKFIAPITLQRLAKIKLKLNEISETKAGLTELNDYFVELSIAFDKVKKGAITKYNSSIDEKKSAELLFDAKKEIDKNNYTSAYLILSKPSTGSFNYLTLLPVIALAAIGFGIKKYSDNQKKHEKDKTKEVSSAWEEDY